MTDFDAPPLELRYAGVQVDGVDFEERTITVIAVPYEQPAPVMYRSEVWNEIFTRGAFDDLSAPHRVRANRDHDKSRTVGKATRFHLDRPEGLIAEIRIARTPLGDETLALAAEDCLSCSVGFGARPKDQLMDRRSMTRRINKGYLDHISFVESPAYSGAKVLSVRDTTGGDAAGLEPIRTPRIDQSGWDEISRWASERLNR